MEATQNKTLYSIIRSNKILIGIIFTLMLITLWSLGLFNGQFFSGIVRSNQSVDLLQSGWEYMPGTTAQPDGLHVSYLGRAIVQQDGSPGQTNPATNIYGNRLEVSKDFTLTAIVKDLKGMASLRLYSDAPTVQDEFRIEPKGLDIVLADSTLTINQWGEYKNEQLRKQKPIKTYAFTVTPQESNVVTLQRNTDTLRLYFNGTPVKELSYGSVLSNSIWFGVSAIQPEDKWTLASLTATSDSASAVKVVNAQNTTVSRTSPETAFQSLANKKRSDFYIGAAVSLAPSIADARYRNLAYGGNFGTMTTENALKWQAIHPQPNTYDFKEANALVALAQKNNMKVQGHALVFGEANPKWVQDLPTATPADKEKVKQVMVDHITRTVSHFKGQIYAWDVVNEPLDDYDRDPSALRPHIWYNAMGEDYIGLAFAAARAADPKAKLYINDYGIEHDGERWDAMLALVTKLKKQGVPIDGVGFESHVYSPGDEINPNTLRQHIRALAAIGVSSHISEIDVHDDNGTTAQAQQYATVLNACINEPACTSWTTWGVTDKYNLYESDAGTLLYGNDFLWDKQAQPTPAVLEMQKTLKNSNN